MANRRMFSKNVIDSDVFLDMPMSTQGLYFHLAMRADDDGFINNPKSIMRLTGCKDDDFKVLIAKGFVLGFESGVIVISHWRLHNYIQKDRYTETINKAEKSFIRLSESNVYEMDTECIQDGYTGKGSLGKGSLGKGSEYIYNVEDNKRVSKAKKEAATEVANVSEEVIAHLNSIGNTSFKASTQSFVKNMKAILKAHPDISIEDINTVVDYKHNEWKGTPLYKHFVPGTLFRLSNFEKYIEQVQRAISVKTEKEVEDEEMFRQFEAKQGWG